MGDPAEENDPPPESGEIICENPKSCQQEFKKSACSFIAEDEVISGAG